MKNLTITLILIGIFVLAFGAVVFLFPNILNQYDPNSPSAINYLSVKRVTIALTEYLGDFDDVYPAAQDQATFQKQIKPKLHGDEVVWSDPQHQTSVTYNTRLANVRWSTLPDLNDVIAVWSPYADSPNSPIRGYAVGFGAGFAQTRTAEEWKTEIADKLDHSFPRVSQTFLPVAKP